MTLTSAALAAEIDAGIAAAAEALFARQRPDGSWQGYLPSSAVSTGSAVIALHTADPDGTADLVQAGVDWLRAAQLDDGGWGDVPEGPAGLNATAIAVAALRLFAPGCPELERGLARLERFGGPDAVADRSRCTLKAVCEHYLAAAGLYPEHRLGRMPIELILAPRRLRTKLSFTVPGLMAWGLMQSRTRRFSPPRRLLNRLAEPKALAYLAALHEYEGPDGAAEESALMASVVLFGLARAGLAPDIVRDYIRYLRATVRPDGSWPVDRDLEFSASMYVTHGLLDAGYGTDPRLRRIERWIRDAQRTTAFPATGCPPGGWSWSAPSGWPDSDDTAAGVYALAALGVDPADPQLRRGIDWLRAMRNRDGSWGCFARDARVSMDAPCSLMTAHAVNALHAVGEDTDAAVRWFARVQRPDGSFSCVWFRDHTAGTARVLDALGRLGLGDSATAARCRAWLVAHQRPDGGWGDGGDAPSTAEETAWAVLGLINSGHADHPATRAGVRWLLDHQRPDGLWQPARVGFYFLGLTYWCEHMADGYAVQALGRYRAVTEG